jgi:outer membrane protein assembly factor BamB
MSIIFSSLHHRIVVTKNADGSFSWTGQYNNTPIKCVIAIDNGNRCILLLDPDASTRPAFENLFCIDKNGNTIWTAKLPTSPDVFVEIIPTSDGVLAKTWSGFSVLLNQNTGIELKRKFIK